MTNAGSDFFSLFGSGKKKEQVSLHDVMRKWERIDQHHSGIITKQEATAYLAHKKENKFLPAEMVSFALKKQDLLDNPGAEIIIKIEPVI